jgi:nucleoside-diphosphate-sugar epimerase
MTVLLTGIPGWLGSRFLEILVKGFEDEGPINDWKLRCLVLGTEDSSYLDELADDKPFEKVMGDVTKPESLKAAVKNVDIVFHMGGIIHPKKVSDFYTINTFGTNNILKESLSAGVKKFIYISSNSAAGINKDRGRLMTEEDEPHPYLNYGLSKYYAECAVRDSQATGKIQTVILRPCWFYGPYQPSRQSRFFKMIQKGNPPIFGNGLNLRSLTYIDNLSQAMLLSASNENANGRTYWIADRQPYPTYEIYRTVAELLEVNNFKPIYIPDLVSEGCRLADRMVQAFGMYIPEIHVAGEMNKDIACCIEKASEELSYNPKIELREGMRRSIQWCKENNIL